MNKTFKTLHRVVIRFAPCSSIKEGADLYRTISNNATQLYATAKEAYKDGWRKKDIVEVCITYKRTEEI